MSPEGAESETARKEPVSRPFEHFSRPFMNPNPKPTEAELERAIVDALRMGLADVAKTIGESLDARRRVGKVVDLESKRRR
jgi:hypothetical protein